MRSGGQPINHVEPRHRRIFLSNMPYGRSSFHLAYAVVLGMLGVVLALLANAVEPSPAFGYPYQSNIGWEYSDAGPVSELERLDADWLSGTPRFETPGSSISGVGHTSSQMPQGFLRRDTNPLSAAPITAQRPASTGLGSLSFQPEPRVEPRLAERGSVRTESWLSGDPTSGSQPASSAIATSETEPSGEPTSSRESVPSENGTTDVVHETEDTAPEESHNDSQQAQRISTYVAEPGDSVAGIADRFGISALTLVRVNALPDPESLAIGTELTILPISGFLHTIDPGDTVLDLAERYGVIPEEIIAVNQLVEPYVIHPDKKLMIPEIPEDRRLALHTPYTPSEPLKPTVYTVGTGDNLAGIAARFGVSLETLLWANEIGDPSLLHPGMDLIVPPVTGLLYSVVEEDTVSRIAARYSTSAADIIRANALLDPYVLEIGQKLIVPDGVPPTPPVIRQQAPTAQETAASEPTPVVLSEDDVQPTPTAEPPPQPAPQPAASISGDELVAFAMQFLGYRYVWGGTSPQPGFDCSGFIWYVFRQNGIPVPRDLWGQMNSGPRIARAELQIGDVVFFQNTYTTGLSHVGIYIGGGEFVHAASENTGVIITRLSNPYWDSRYVGASRLH